MWDTQWNRGLRIFWPTVWAHLFFYGISAPFYFSGGSFMSKKIGIVMGSDSDLPIVSKAVDMLKELQIPYEVHIYSAHRTPEQAGSSHFWRAREDSELLSQLREWLHILRAQLLRAPLSLLSEYPANLQILVALRLFCLRFRCRREFLSRP